MPPAAKEQSPVWRYASYGAIAISWVLLLITAALPIFDVDWWWVRIWDFPRLQLMFSYIAAAAVVFAVSRQRRIAWATTAALVIGASWQLYWVFPYLPVAPRQTKNATTEDGERRLLVMTANVLMTNRSSASLLKIVDVAKPDILVLTEPDNWWAKELASLKSDYPHAIEVPLDNTYGMIVYSKQPIAEFKVEYIVEPGTPSIEMVVSLTSGEPIRLFAVHPSPPRPGDDTDERDAELVIVGRRARQSKLPAVVVGDMNDVGWSANTRLFQNTSGLLDPRRGRGLYATFPADYAFLRYPLDHLFHSDDFRIVSIEVLDDFGSDHLPVLFELSFEPHVAHRQEAPQATPETRREAQEQVDKVQDNAD